MRTPPLLFGERYLMHPDGALTKRIASKYFNKVSPDELMAMAEQVSPASFDHYFLTPYSPEGISVEGFGLAVEPRQVRFAMQSITKLASITVENSAGMGSSSEYVVGIMTDNNFASARIAKGDVVFVLITSNRDWIDIVPGSLHSSFDYAIKAAKILASLETCTVAECSESAMAEILLNQLIVLAEKVDA